MHLCVFHQKTGSGVVSREARDLEASRERSRDCLAAKQLPAKCCWAKTDIFLKSDRESRDCLATVSRLRASRENFMLQWLLSRLSRDCLAAPYPAKNACFQFYRVDVTVFSNHNPFPRLTSLKAIFHPNHYSIKILSNLAFFSTFYSSRYVL